MSAQSIALALPLIKQFEGCKLTAYQDIVGVWTIGWGTTGSWIKPGTTITQDEADDSLEQAVAAIDSKISTAGKLSDNQIAALDSFAYNLGLNALLQSTLWKCVVRGDMTAAADEFIKWDHAGSKVVAGLFARRMAEKKLFQTAATPA